MQTMTCCAEMKISESPSTVASCGFCNAGQSAELDESAWFNALAIEADVCPAEVGTETEQSPSIDRSISCTDPPLAPVGNAENLSWLMSRAWVATLPRLSKAKQASLGTPGVVMIDVTSWVPATVGAESERRAPPALSSPECSSPP